MFMGTPDFAGYSLKKLIENKYNVTSVITRADTKKGRGQKVQFSPVKDIAIENNIPVYQPHTLKEEYFHDILNKENPDLIVVVAYGRILPKYVLEFPKYGCINVHGSLLPKYRGAAPIQYAVAMGDKKSGVTTMLMNEGLDTGDMLLIQEVDITEQDTGGSLHDKLMVVGADLLIKTIENLDEIEPIPQDDSQATFSPPIKKEDTMLDFNCDAKSIVDKIRGYYPFPKTNAIINDVCYKILNAELYNTCDNQKYGEILEFSKNRLLISAKNGTINVLEIQPPNKKAMPISDFYNGCQGKI